jgi:hypothetical protein
LLNQIAGLSATKVAALGTGLGLAMAVFNAGPGLTWFGEEEPPLLQGLGLFRGGVLPSRAAAPWP